MVDGSIMAKSRRTTAPSRGAKKKKATAPSNRAAPDRSSEHDAALADSSESLASSETSLDPWEEPCRPLVSLIFVAPILLAYEAGILALGHEQVRNGADVWLRTTLDWLGFGQYFLLPSLVCSILLAWHHVSRQAWTFGTGVLARMFVETSVFALLLLFLAQAQSQLLTATHGGLGAGTLEQAALEQAAVASTLLATSAPDSAAGMVGYLGAGLYEELLFRLMLLPTLAALLRMCGARPTLSLFGAIVASSLLFAAAHYRFDFALGSWHVTTHGEAFNGFSFAFRWLAGGLFGVLFVYRGFGIAVGTHALYDILAVVF